MFLLLIVAVFQDRQGGDHSDENTNDHDVAADHSSSIDVANTAPRYLHHQDHRGAPLYPHQSRSGHGVALHLSIVILRIEDSP